MRKLLILAAMLACSNAYSAPKCAIDAVQTNRDSLRYVDAQEAKNYIQTWCSLGRATAETYLAQVLNERADSLSLGFAQISKEDTEERRHQELLQTIRDSGDYCFYSALPEYCAAKRILR